MKIALNNLSSKLIKLHRDLLFFQAGLASKSDGHEYTPYELLNLSLNDPRFAWLRQFSELITQIDIMTDDKKSNQGEDIHKDIPSLIFQAKKIIGNETEPISENYRMALLQHAEIVTKRRDAEKALAELQAVIVQKQH